MDEYTEKTMLMELAHSDESEDTSTPHSPEQDTSYCSTTFEKQPLVKVEPEDSPTASDGMMDEMPNVLAIEARKPANRDKFLSIVDILLPNSCTKVQGLKTESTDRRCVIKHSFKHGMTTYCPEKPLTSYPERSGDWESTRLDGTNHTDYTKWLVGNTNSSSQNHQIVSGIFAEHGLPSITSGERVETSSERENCYFKKNTTIQADNENTCSSPDEVLVNGSEAKHTEMSSRQEVSTGVNGFNMSRVPQFSGTHPVWLGQAIWRHMWHSRLAVSYPLGGVSFSPFGQGLSPVIAHNETRSASQQTVLAVRAHTSGHQAGKATDAIDSRRSLGEVRSPDTKMGAEPDLEQSPSPPAQVKLPFEPSLSNRRRRRQRQAYSTLQLSTLEGEFKMNRYLSSEKREALSQQLSLSENQVKAWFQNRRTKDKKQQTNQGSVVRSKSNNSVTLKESERQLVTSFAGQAATPSMASPLLVPHQHIPGTGSAATRLLWTPSRYHQTAPLGLFHPAYQTRGVTPDLNTAYASQASNYLALLQKIL